jgi:hypothetical protein
MTDHSRPDSGPTSPGDPDDITRGLDDIFHDFFGPPTERDINGIEPATFARGLAIGFTDANDALVVENNRRLTAQAALHWEHHHASVAFLGRCVGDSELALAHLKLLNRAHPRCEDCEAMMELLSQQHETRPDSS